MVATPLTTALWVCSIVLPVLLLGVALRKGLARSAPAFVFFIAFLVLRDGLLFVIHALWPHAYKAYFCLYWGSDFLVMVLRVLVVVEIFRAVVADHPRFRQSSRRILVVLGGALLLFAVASGSLHPANGVDRWIAYLLWFRRGTLMIEAGLLVSLLALSAFFGLSWRSMPFGIAMGLTVYGVLQTAAVAIAAQVGRHDAATAEICNSATYVCANLVWLAYCTRHPERRLPSGTLEDPEQHRALLDLLTS